MTDTFLIRPCHILNNRNEQHLRLRVNCDGLNYIHHARAFLCFLARENVPVQLVDGPMRVRKES